MSAKIALAFLSIGCGRESSYTGVVDQLIDSEWFSYVDHDAAIDMAVTGSPLFVCDNHLTFKQFDITSGVFEPLANWFSLDNEGSYPTDVRHPRITAFFTPKVSQPRAAIMETLTFQSATGNGPTGDAFIQAMRSFGQGQCR